MDPTGAEGTGWIPPEHWVAVETRHPWAAKPPGLGNNTLVTAGPVAGWPPAQGHGCQAPLHSVLCQQGAVGGSAPQQDLTPWSPHAQCSHPGKAFPALSLQLPWELLQFGQHQSPIPAWEGETKQGPALVSASSIVMESIPIWYCVGQESSSLQP